MLPGYRYNTVERSSPRKSLRLFHRLAFLLYVLPLAPLGHAQSARELQNLVFDPVLIELVERAPGLASGEEAAAGPVFDVVELSSLPDGEKVDLQSWFFSRQVVAAETDPQSIVNAVAEYENSIAALEISGGAYEPRLSQELLSLGTLLQQSGDYSRARAVFERASHVNRVNHGLHNLDQIPIVEKTIENYLAEGNLIAADEQQQYLFYLQRKSLGDFSVDLLPALTRYAEWNVYAFNSRLYARSLAQVGDTFTELPQTDVDLNLEDFRTRSLVNAQNIYQSIIRILMSNYGISDPRLLDIEKRLALTNYFFATSFMGTSNLASATAMAYGVNQMPYDVGNISTSTLGYRQGREALERRIRYMQQMEGISPGQLAAARLDHGDWLLIFSKRMGALDVFADAYQQMQAANVPQREIDAIFKPALPEQIPEFLAHSNTRSALGIPDNIALEYKGHIDVEYTLSRFGQAETIKVLGKSESVTNDIIGRLERNLRRSQFRPRYHEGKLIEKDVIRARYYFTY